MKCGFPVFFYTKKHIWRLYARISSFVLQGEGIEVVFIISFPWKQSHFNRLFSRQNMEAHRHGQIGRMTKLWKDEVFPERQTSVWCIRYFLCRNVQNEAEPWKIDALEPWSWRRLLRVPWTAKKLTNGSDKIETRRIQTTIITPVLRYFDHITTSASLEKDGVRRIDWLPSKNWMVDSLREETEDRQILRSIQCAFAESRTKLDGTT